ncbi:MAG: chromate transporter [Clostridia bacterium]|nr:chromate transporter [Clostridia bacterium]
MIYLQLFLIFLEVGALSFGGGYGMIALIQEKMLSYGWLSEEAMLNIIAVAESTPGPIAVNLATFVGSSQGGVLGAFLATLGVVLPSFIIILIVVTLIKNLLKYKPVNAFLDGLRPVVTGLIIATAIIYILSKLFSFSSIGDTFSPDLPSIIIFFAIAAVAALYKAIRKKALSPIILIIISAGLGAGVYAFI